MQKMPQLIYAYVYAIVYVYWMYRPQLIYAYVYAIVYVYWMYSPLPVV